MSSLFAPIFARAEPQQLAVEGGGSYAFIPDSGFVGTVFVNALANTLVTVAQPALLTFLPAMGAT